MLSMSEERLQRYVSPLVAEGKLSMTMPDKPKSRNQKYFLGINP